MPDPSHFLGEVAKKVCADMTAYERCMAAGKDAQVQQRVAAGQALGFNGTPSFQLLRQMTGKTYTLVGAQPVEGFTRWIDDLLAGKEPPKDEEARPRHGPKAC